MALAGAYTCVGIPAGDRWREGGGDWISLE